MEELDDVPVDTVEHRKRRHSKTEAIAILAVHVNNDINIRDTVHNQARQLVNWIVMISFMIKIT